MSRVHRIIITHPHFEGRFVSYYITSDYVLAKYPANVPITEQMELEQMLNNREQIEAAVKKYGTLVESEPCPMLWVEEVENNIFGAACCVNDPSCPPFNGFWLGDNREQKKLYWNGAQVVTMPVNNMFSSLFSNHLIIGRFYLADVNQPILDIKNHYNLNKLTAAIKTSTAEDIAYINPALAVGYLNAATGLEFKQVGNFKPKRRMGMHGRPASMSWVYEDKKDPCPYRITATYHYGKNNEWAVNLSPISSK